MISFGTAKWLPALAFVVITASQSARADLIFNDASTNGSSPLGAEIATLSHITVSAPTVINQIAVMVDLATAGNIKFLVYNYNDSSFEFVSTAQLFAADGMNFKLSEVFAGITLLPGVDYFIGGISDTAGSWASLNPAVPVTQNGITNQGLNGNITGFAGTLEFIGTSSAQIPIQIFGPGSSSAVPEPATWATGLIGALFCSGIAIRRRRRVA